MLELSIPARFAFMFAMLMIANKEYKRLVNIEKMGWSEIFATVLMMALACFIAGVLLFESLVEILHMPTG